MLTITVPGQEFFDEKSQEFVTTDSFVLDLEHSLVSLSKWESKWEKPYLSKTDKTEEEVLSYLECMILTPIYPPDIVSRLTIENMKAIADYVDAKMTATWFNEPKNQPRSREIITAELIYYWLVALTIPLECETWHLNRLFTLIKICNLKNDKPKKMGRKEAAIQQRDLNAQRKAQLGTTG